MKADESRSVRSERSGVLERLFALEQFGIKLGLHNIQALVNALGEPHRAFPSVHIAGTNGKGSVSAMVERGLRSAGHRTGRYTSPHLSRIEERVAIDGMPVAENEFASVAAHVLDVADRLRREGALGTTPTFFETTTAIAFEAFRRAGVDVAVVEVGLGGRFDATNIITPAITAITSIALDHETHLGDSVASIAFEKAGILKRGVPCVLGDVPTEARQVIETAAADVGATIVPADLRLAQDVQLVRGRATICVDTPLRRYREMRLGLSGRHQVANAIVAIRALELLEVSGVRLAHADIVSAVRDVEWPARLEWLQLQSGSRVLIDAAHNPAGAEALAEYIRDSGSAPVAVVLAVMKDKDVESIARALAPVASRFVTTALPLSRALSAIDLRDRIRRACAGALVEHAPNPEAALRAALAATSKAVAAGSIFFVGPLRAQLIAAGAVSLRD
ncbi:MAG TPA: Mur ligase family protein [Vicinamibacterales bacterium]|nr:Mur ligase family protein [Vicinamibacterales bacterium]